MRFRRASIADADALATLNQQLIQDEGHRNPMTLPELERRMAGWLAGEYEAVIWENGSDPLGYALYRREPEQIYLRQFFVHRAHRRRGLGREAIAWLRANAWNGTPRLRVDVLVGNTKAIAFWRAVGFRDYALTMEAEAK
jgi:GNAT superfamily N-acetyltransferase